MVEPTAGDLGQRVAQAFIAYFRDSGPQARLIEMPSPHFRGAGRFRTHEQIRDLFRNLDLVDPGLVYLARLRPYRIVRDKPTVIERLMADGIARKPDRATAGGD